VPEIAPQQRAWRADLPKLIRDVERRWSVRLGPPYPGGTCAWVAPATLPGGSPAVLKISWPHREAAGEADALRIWDGRGAVRLYRHDPERWALLLQRCDPGTKLGEKSELTVAARLEAAARVLRDLHDTPAPAATGRSVDRLADRMAEWADLTEERMARLRPGFDPGLVDLGVRLLRELPGTAVREVVVHADFNPGNILAVRGGWLAIDPKPLIGDGSYDPWPLIQQVDNPFVYLRARQLVADRFALVAEVLGMDPWRPLAWSVARCVEDALWTVEHGYPVVGGELMSNAYLLANLADR
jgi:streptomycin 6-kinase